MRHLHTFMPPPPRVVWFGPAYLCDNPYHNGYESERGDLSSHTGCALTLLGTGDAYRCECRTCTGRYPYRHFFGVTDIDNIEASNMQNGRYLCDGCITENHPIPPAPGDNVH